MSSMSPSSLIEIAPLDPDNAPEWSWSMLYEVPIALTTAVAGLGIVILPLVLLALSLLAIYFVTGVAITSPQMPFKQVLAAALRPVWRPSTWVIGVGAACILYLFAMDFLLGAA